MLKKTLSRRQWLSGCSGLVAAGMEQGKDDAKQKLPFRFSLNTATIMGQELTLPQEIDVAGNAGYDGIEPWISKIEKYVKGGGNLKDIGKRARDHGLVIPNAIGFFKWIVDDEATRKAAFEEAKRAMDLVQQVGGQRLAAPPLGATERRGLDLFRAAERYRQLLELGDKMGVTPVAEVWGFSRTLSRLGEAALVAIETGHPKACVLADVFHLYKGGSGYGGLKLLSAAALPILHMNDYPADPPREKITDAQRIYPGDGIAPIKSMLRDLRSLGFQGYLSLELFNRDYWKQDALAVARTGLAKMRATAQASLN
jgi:sugar phosphate isomerase/epimerase